MDFAPPIGQEAQGEAAIYIDGNPEAGIEGSAVPAKAIEPSMRELIHLIRFAGLTPSGTDREQVRKAIGMLIESATPGLATLLQPGLVMPDGVTIKVDGTGKLTVPDVYVRLATDLTIYVATTGDDSNDGLTAATPLRTVQGALNKVSSAYNIGTHVVTVSVAAGTYTEFVNLPKYQASTGYIKIVGAGIDATIIGGVDPGAMSLFSDASYLLLNLTLTAAKATSYNPRCLLVTAGRVQVNNVKFFIPATATGTYPLPVWVQDAGVITLGTGDGATIHIVIDVSALYILHASDGGKIVINNPLSISGSATGACASAQMLGLIVRSSIIMPMISGPVTGPRYIAAFNGILSTSGGGASYFPGTGAGSVQAGGQYA